MIEFVLAEHTANLTRHCEAKQVLQSSDEATLTLIGSLDELKNVRMLSIGDYEVSIDHGTQTVRHLYHSDPAIPFQWKDASCLQIFLHNMKIASLPEVVTIMTNDGRTSKGKATRKASTAKSIHHSVLGVKKDWKLFVDEKADVDLIIQRQIAGREEEEKIILPPGPHFIDLRGKHAERFGICLSWSDDPFGGVEFKHNLFGEVGLVSGRFLWSEKRVWLPPTPQIPSYRSLIVDLTKDHLDLDRDFEQELKRASDIEIITSPKNREAAYKIAKAHGSDVKITVAGRANEESPCEIFVFNPDEPVREDFKGPISFLLFRDQSELNFQSDLAATLKRLSSDPAIRANSLERRWLDAMGAPLSCDNERRFGIAWSTSSTEEQRGKIDLFKAKLIGDLSDVKDIMKIAATPFALGNLIRAQQ